MAPVRRQHRHDGGGESGGDALRLRPVLPATELARGEAAALPQARGGRVAHRCGGRRQPGEGAAGCFTQDQV